MLKISKIKHLPSLIFIYFSLILVLSFTSCEEEDELPNSVIGFSPVYASIDTSNLSVQFSSPRETQKPGKILTHNNFVFQVDFDTGIHIIDYSQKDSIKKIGFYEILGCSELSMNYPYLYVIINRNFLVLNISDIRLPTIESYSTNVFNNIYLDLPPLFGYFICPDPDKTVLYWEEKEIKKPNCRF